MNLPARLYYPLPEAAKKIGCSIKDIIHYGAIGAINLSVYISLHHSDDGSWFHLNLPSDKVKDIDELSGLSGDGWSIDFVEFKSVSNGFMVEGYYARAISGFFYIDSHPLIDAEFSDLEKITLSGVSTSPEPYAGNGIDVSFLLGNQLSINTSKLCVRLADIEGIKLFGSMPDGRDINKKESIKTVAKKEKIIKGLLMIIPEFSDQDIDSIPVKKIKELVESISASRGIEFPDTDLGTWSKYLERGRFEK